MIQVVQIFRKRNPFFFSIEKVFALVKPGLSTKIQLTAISLPFYTHGLLSVVRNLYFVYRTPSKDLYHVTGDVHYAVLALPASRTILTIHDCVFLYSATGIKRRILKWLLLDMPVKRAAIVTTISDFTKQEILRFTHCNEDKVVVIPNPVNDAIRFEKKAFNTSKPVLLFIGTTPNKNLERVIAALAGISCHLLILGITSVLQEQLLAKHHVDFSVRSNISESELADVYIQSDIVLFPSTFEGFGLPVLEAQKAGRVIITSNIDPMQKVAGGGAFLVDPYDVNDIRHGIEKIIGNADTRNACIENGFSNIIQYNASRITDAYCGLYEKLTKNNTEID